MPDAPPPDAALLVAKPPGLHILTLNRPQKLNAFDGAMHAALLAALAAAEHDPECRAVLLRGAGRGFCAGQDLAEPGLTGPDPDLGAVVENGWNRAIRAIRALPKPVVCAVHGSAAGAGASLALACDITLAAEDARFTLAFIRIGLVPDAGGTWLLPRLIGPQRALAMAMLGEPVSGAEAARWGLIWRAVPAEALAAEAEALANRLARLPAAALAATKQAMEGAGLEAQLAAEVALQRRLGRGADYAEGVAAFQQKRPARFAGAPAGGAE